MRISALIFFMLRITALSFRPAATSQPAGSSAIIVKLRFHSAGSSGYGGSLRVRNMETGARYESHAKIGLNPFVIIEDLPLGTYKVEELNIISGTNVLPISDESKFNSIKVDSIKAYYVGAYLAEKVPPHKGLHFSITKMEDDNIGKVHKQLAKKSENAAELMVDFEQHLFLAELTDIDLKR
jgi:hypothetical protein